MKTKLLVLLLALAPFLSACPNELAAIDDRIAVDPITITVQPNQAAIGGKVNVTAKATLIIDPRSTLPEVPLLISIGACFAEGVTKDGTQSTRKAFASLVTIPCLPNTTYLTVQPTLRNLITSC